MAYINNYTADSVKQHAAVRQHTVPMSAQLYPARVGQYTVLTVQPPYSAATISAPARFVDCSRALLLSWSSSVALLHTMERKWKWYCPHYTV